MEINDIDFEQDQQDLIEKTDVQTLASYCQELQQKKMRYHRSKIC